MGDYCAITEEGTKPGGGKKKKKRGSFAESFAVVRSSPKVRWGVCAEAGACTSALQAACGRGIVWIHLVGLTCHRVLPNPPADPEPGAADAQLHALSARAVCACNRRLCHPHRFSAHLPTHRS